MQELSTGAKDETAPDARPPTVVVGSENMMPRFWVLTDHVRREVVLVIRGTMSLNEVAVDLTCDPTPFELHSFPQAPGPKGKGKARDPVEEEDTVWSEFDEELESIPGSFPIDMSTPPLRKSAPQERPVGDARARRERMDSETTTYLVHGGMLKMARAMGAPGKPVHVAVRDALKRNRGYCMRLSYTYAPPVCSPFVLTALVMCGHSLGAGVAALLALVSEHP